MHFSIPDTQDLKGEQGSSYIAYNVYVNGAFHCTVRYRQLHNLHDQLKREYGQHSLPIFPPKKFLPLTPTQIEERRVLLEKYIQQISQDARIANSELFTGFLLSAQQETQNAKEETADLDVYMMNWQKVSVCVSSLDKSSDVLNAVCASLNLEEKHISYFCLYLITKQQHEISVERRLQDIEAPYLSLKTAGSNYSLVIRKSYWDPSYDEDLMEDKVALTLLYVQAVSDVEQGWTVTNEETKKRLAILQARGSKHEYLKLARTLRLFGHIQFRPCICDYPQPNTPVIVYAGGKDFIFKFSNAAIPEKEIAFRVTRIKCWRITTSISDVSSITTTSQLSSKLRLELSFEYLVGKDDLKWVCVVSDQAIMMSVCLQGMVNELLQKRKGGINITSNKSGRMSRSGSWNYMKRDGSSHQISSVCRSVSHDAIASSNRKDEANFVSGRSKGQIRRITEKFSSVKVKNGMPMSPKELVENDAFDGIGDDDL